MVRFFMGGSQLPGGFRCLWSLTFALLTVWGGGLTCALAEVPLFTRPDRVDAMVQAGTAFLIRSQLPDGMIHEVDKRETHGAAMTGLALMALAAVGHQPADRSAEGEVMRKAVAYLLRPDGQTPGGYFGHRDGSRMYGHGIMTLVLTELLGMGADKTQDAMLREKAQRGVNLILASQRVKKYDPRFFGGWRYTPDAGDADLSITVWQLMALRSAKNAGLTVPKESIDAAVGYLRRSYFSGRDAQGRVVNPKSGFGYVPGTPPQFAMVAAGMLAMQVCGLHDAPEVLGAAEWLRTAPPVWESSWFFYGTYYFAQAAHKRGGELARVTQERVGELLAEHQMADGAWQGVDGSENGQGRVYCTAMALLSLSVRYHYLPIYQE
ncbi:MAG: hypothetical protein EBS05_03500 [Proteobacteria bacterium]|nr:hypothetical protein [Pseudomonadota bacterium]